MSPFISSPVVDSKRVNIFNPGVYINLLYVGIQCGQVVAHTTFQYMHVHNKKKWDYRHIKKRNGTFTIYHTAYLSCIRGKILTLLDSVSSYNNDRASNVIVFEINVIFISNNLCS